VKVNFFLANLAWKSSRLHNSLLSATLGVVKPIQPHHEAGLMHELKRSRAFTRRNEVMSGTLGLLKANPALSSRVLKMEGTAVFHTAEDVDFACLDVFARLVVLFLIGGEVNFVQAFALHINY
jgi:hypothetical protein